MIDSLNKYIWPVVAIASMSLSTAGMVLGAKAINKIQTPTAISISYPEGYLDLVDSPDLPEKNVENSDAIGKTVKKPIKKATVKVPIRKKTASTTRKSTTTNKIKKPVKLYPI